MLTVDSNRLPYLQIAADLRRGGRVLVTEPVAKMMTARNWREFQRCERCRQLCFRAILCAAGAVTLFILLILK